MRAVTVIGGGLSGLYAAYAAASHGADVNLYEKSIIGSKHNCGEMFTETYIRAPDDCKLNPIDTFLFNIKGESISIDFGDNSPFIMTDKCVHENIIKKKCLSLGVKIYEKTKASVSETKGRYVIDASGTSTYNMSMGKAVVFITKRHCGAGVTNDIPYSTSVFNIRDDLMGYSWIFPRGWHQLNVGEGVYNYKYNTQLISPDKSDILYRGGGLLPMPDMKQYCLNVNYYNNYIDNIRVGNAAGLVNPLAGGGEHLAAISGMIAGELVAKRKERFYYNAIDEIVGDEMRFGISMYEFMKRQDSDTVKKIISSKILSHVDDEIINGSIRKSMKKWITIPEVNESELVEFAGE